MGKKRNKRYGKRKKMKEVKGRRRKDVADIETGKRNRMHKGRRENPDLGKPEI